MIVRKVNALVTAVVLLLAGVLGYQLVRANVAEQVYHDRLADLSEEFEDLRDTYNSAVRKTAVTELDVHDGKLEVVIVSAAGELERIPTPFDPSEEIHVDYLVLDGRLWIRRIHDSKTPASQAQQIDPRLAQIDWDADGETYGLSIYRPLGEGRWVISTTTGGALTLARKPDSEPTRLRPPPEIRQFEEIERDVRQQVDDIGPGDVLRVLVGRNNA